MWKYKNKTIKVGRSFKDDDGVIHPPNWNIWSAEEKKAMQITEVVEEHATPQKKLVANVLFNAAKAGVVDQVAPLIESYFKQGGLAK